MKKTRTIICITCSIAVIASIIVISILSVLLISKLNVVTLTPHLCNWLLLGNTPQSFCETEGAGTSLEDGYVFSGVDKNGNLIIVMTDAQKDNWRNGEASLQIMQKAFPDKDIVSNIKPPDMVIWKQLYETAKVENCVVISDDYKTVQAYSGSNILYHSVWVKGCLLTQIIQGVDTADIYLEYFYYDDKNEVLGRVIHTADGSIMYDKDGNVTDEIVF